MKQAFSTQLFGELPVIGILRGFNLGQVEQIVPAAGRGGLRNLEITMNTPAASEQIRRASEISGGAMNIGAGTVTNLGLLEEAIAAGASFIVTPTVQARVIRACVERGIPVYPGAFTPTEIERAWDLGAAMVKIFPAEAVGPRYIKAIKAPLPHLKLLPTGGVDLNTLAGYIKAGADGFGVGSPLFGKAPIEAGDWGWVEKQCRAFATIYQEHARKAGA